MKGRDGSVGCAVDCRQSRAVGDFTEYQISFGCWCSGKIKPPAALTRSWFNARHVAALGA